MKLLKRVPSRFDKTVKYIFEVEEGLVVEYSYIDNNTGKDILCVPCQTMCNMSCTFCHLTDHVGKIKLKDLTSQQIVEGITAILHDKDLKGDRPLLISYMGCGEPLANMRHVLDSMLQLKSMDALKELRFGMATMLPRAKWSEFFSMIKEVEKYKIPLKVHLSLHFTNDRTRSKWMPSAWSIKHSLAALDMYHSVTENPVEVHYTVMQGINDSQEAIERLSKLVSLHTTIKLMRYSEKDSLDVKEADMKNIEQIKHYLSLPPMRKIEYYEPPGIDIGASCGQFLLNDTLKTQANATVRQME